MIWNARGHVFVLPANMGTKPSGYWSNRIVIVKMKTTISAGLMVERLWRGSCVVWYL